MFCVLTCASAFFLATKEIVAQPGETRTFEEIEKQLKSSLEEINKNFNVNQSHSDFYEGRGYIYYRLYENKVSHKGLHDKIYAQNGIADFTKALELADKSYTPNARNSAKAKILSLRAMLYETIWQYQVYRIPETSVKIRLKYLFESIDFKNAVSDYQKATQLDSETKAHFNSLSRLYEFRAGIFSYSPELLKEIRSQNKTDSIWKDFDSALKYGGQAREKSYSFWATFDIMLKKGKIAFEVGRYDVALDAYLSDEKYLGKNYQNLCGETRGEFGCDKEKRVFKYTFSFRRATVYIKLGKPEKALSEMEVFFANVFHTACPQPFLVRAEAYRQVGKIELAAADEKKARDLPPVGHGVCDY